MNKIVSVLAPVVVLAAGAGVYGLLHWAKPEPEKRQEPARPISAFVIPAKTEDVLLEVRTSGEVRARTEVDLVAQVPGRIMEVSGEFTEGGVITPGQVILVIEPTDYQLAMLQAEAAVADARVDLEQSLANADVARKQLRDANRASDLALKKPQVAQARARLKAADANLAQARVNLARTEISLPYHGRFVETFVDVGQYVTPGTRLGRAFATDVVEVRLPLNDEQLAALDLPIGYIATDEGPAVELSARVAGRDQVWQAHLVRLDASVERETRTLYGIAEIQAPYTEGVSQHQMPLAVGLYVNARIDGPQLHDVVTIPRESLRAGSQVHLVNKAGRLEVRSVKAIYTTSEKAVIGYGIEAGEQVVVSSIRNPVGGMAITALTRNLKETAVRATRQARDNQGS